MTTEQFMASAVELEKAFKQVQNVVSAKVNYSKDGLIESIYILANPGRSPKQITQDILSILRVHSSQKLDSERVNITILTEEWEQELLGRRPKLHSVALTSRMGMGQATVELVSGARTFVGQANGPLTSSFRLRLVAEATLQAVKEFLPEDLYFTVDDVLVVQVTDRKVVLVAITCSVLDIKEDRVTGSATIKFDELEAVARATLQAINRKLNYRVGA